MMKHFQTANSSLTAILAIIGCIITVLVVTNYSADAPITDADFERAAKAQSYIGSAITYTLYLTGAALGLFVLGLMVFGLFIRPMRMIPLYGGIVGLLVVFGISWSMTNGEIPLKFMADLETNGLTEGISHWSGAGLYMVYILSALAVASIGYSMISKLVR